MTISKQAAAITFYAFYVASKAGSTGLTVTVDVYETTSGTPIVSGGSAIELAGGLYYYTLSGGSVDANGSYLAVFKTTDSNVDQQHLPALWYVADDGIPAEVRSYKADVFDATVMADDAITAAMLATDAIGADAIAADAIGSSELAASAATEIATAVWASSTRTLTTGTSSVTVVSAVSGSTITVYQYDTWSFTVTDTSLSMTDYDNLIFVVKEDASDADASAILHVDITTGLEYIGKAAASAASAGSITKDSATAFTVLIAMSEVASKIATTYNGSYRWTLKGIDTDDDPDQGFVLATGLFNLNTSDARAIL